MPSTTTYPVNSIVELERNYRYELLKWLQGHHEPTSAQWDTYYADFLSEESFVYLGEIVNMPGHGIYVGRKGRTFWGFHLEDFTLVTDNVTEIVVKDDE